MKHFIKNNVSFICVRCGYNVHEHPTSSRDHCTECLYGLHVDINPGDRLNQCKGLLKPIGLRLSSKKQQVVYKCLKCGQKVFCLLAPDDNTEVVTKLSGEVWSD